MKRLLYLWLFLLTINFAYANDLPDFVDIVKQHGASVVNITTTQLIKAQNQINGIPDAEMFDFFRHFMPQPPGQAQVPDQSPDQGNDEIPMHSAGSGFIISSDGYILTNAHVIENAQEVTVKLTDRREFKAKIIGSDSRSDIALIKINATNLPVAPIGDPQQLQVGEWVIAIGSPFGFENSVTAGIVSAKGRSLPDENYVPFIQTDVAVNPGNSGGPLFNMRGQVVGINSQIFSRSGGYMGVSFAIPIDVAMQVADQLKAYGIVRRGRLGVVVQEVNAGSAKAFGMAKPIGALVSEVDANGPAAKVGIKPGDVILKFNGQSVNRSIDLPRLVAAAKPGSTAKLEIWRNRAPLALTAILGEIPNKKAGRTKLAKSAAGPDKIGLIVSDLPAQSGNNGILVERSDSFAARAGIAAGDIILAVDDTPIHNVAQFNRIITSVAKNGTIALLIKRDNATIYIPLQVD
ncbi:MAG: DegQ family serine endoprotease [Sulfuriferula sp.]